MELTLTVGCRLHRQHGLPNVARCSWCMTKWGQVEGARAVSYTRLGRQRARRRPIRRPSSSARKRRRMPTLSLHRGRPVGCRSAHQGSGCTRNHSTPNRLMAPTARRTALRRVDEQGRSAAAGRGRAQASVARGELSQLDQSACGGPQSVRVARLCGRRTAQRLGRCN